MNKLQIEQLRQIDPDNGTIQSILMREDINLVQFEKALLFALNTEIQNKNALAAENRKLIIACKEAGVDLNKVLFP